MSTDGIDTDEPTVSPNRSTNGPRLTPQQYVEAISRHADLTVGTSLYPGDKFEQLSRFLRSPPDQQPDLRGGGSGSHPQSEAAFATLYTLEASGRSHVQTLSTADEANAVFSKKLGQQHDAQFSSMLFLRGYPTPPWVSTLGSLFKIDPTFFQQKLQFGSSFGRGDAFSSPSLPSASEGTIRLRFFTLGMRQTKAKRPTQDELEALRRKNQFAFGQYLHDLTIGRNVKLSDSIVRSYHVHDEKHFSIEQEMCMCCVKSEFGWLTLIWLDAGNDLSQGPKGPWCHGGPSHGERDDAEDINHPSPRSEEQPLSLSSRLYPTVQHFPFSSFKWDQLHLRETNQLRGQFQQSARLLHLEYGKSLDRSLMACDAFYSVKELFVFAANSISQVINMIETKLTSDTGYQSLHGDQYSISNLLYHQDILDRVSQTLQENIQDIKDHPKHLWLVSSDDEQRKQASHAASSLIADYTSLLVRSHLLSARCKGGISLVMNQAGIAESKRAISQARKIEQLTLLAFFFLPLSFTTSFFGMNLGDVGEGGLPLWVWVVVSVPVLALSYLVLRIMTYVRFEAETNEGHN